MKKIIAIFDIGKTNKKILLFDSNFNVVFSNSKIFDEVLDDDGYPCDDIESIEKWVKSEIVKIQEGAKYSIKAINFSTHGATIVYLNEKGNRITPLYNYLKPLDDIDFEELYYNNGGVFEFSRRTASPAYGMLNSGLQIYWLKNRKPHYWKSVKSILHYPQYLSYLFTNKITSDFTSLGAHTAMWDYDSMDYHPWLKKEAINLPEPTNGKEASKVNFNGEKIAIGSGLHDSSSSIIPLLNNNKGKEFILLSTGTWIITMNPFSKELLTEHQLNSNCLCFMTPDKQQVKSSMQFLGKAHQDLAELLSKYYKVDIDHHLTLDLNTELCSTIVSKNNTILLSEGFKENELEQFEGYEYAYYQLVFDICKKVMDAIDLIIDVNNSLSDIYISGGFNKNMVFVHYLELLNPKLQIKIPNIKNESALGAALLMKEYL